MRKIRTKLMLAMALISFVSLILSSGVTVLLSADATTAELKKAQAELIVLARRLSETMNISHEEISSMLSSYSIYRLNVQEGAIDFKSEERARIEAGGAVKKGWQARTRTYFMLDGKLMIITASERNVFTDRTSLEGYLNVGITVVITFVFLYLSVMKLTKPLLEMSEATRRIASGDFEARVSVRHDNPSRADQLDTLIANFNRMAEDLKSIAYLRRDFTSNVSHEVKTPIAAISGYAQLMGADALSDDERKSYASLIFAECQRLSKLSDNLLRITRMESSKQALGITSFSLDEQLRRLIAGVMPRVRKSGLTLCVNLAPAQIQSDSELLSQVWINLIDNAIKFTPVGGQIDVKLSKNDKGATVTVSDNGIGMSEDTVPRIFEKFYQADGSRMTEGNGLGLALVKRILDILGGTIDVRSAPGEGSRFSVFLPYSPGARAS